MSTSPLPPKKNVAAAEGEHAFVVEKECYCRVDKERAVVTIKQEHRRAADG